MKARIRGNTGTMYYGEVYHNGTWKKVTPPCFTRTGAKIITKRWIEENIGFDIK